MTVCSYTKDFSEFGKYFGRIDFGSIFHNFTGLLVKLNCYIKSNSQMIDFTYKFLFYCGVFGTGISISESTISCTVTAPNAVLKDNGSLAIGSFALCHKANNGIIGNTATLAGSSLRTTMFYIESGEYPSAGYGGSPSGTWRNVSGHSIGAQRTYGPETGIGLWQRIS